LRSATDSVDDTSPTARRSVAFHVAASPIACGKEVTAPSGKYWLPLASGWLPFWYTLSAPCRHSLPRMLCTAPSNCVPPSRSTMKELLVRSAAFSLMLSRPMRSQARASSGSDGSRKGRSEMVAPVSIGSLAFASTVRMLKNRQRSRHKLRIHSLGTS